MKALRALPFAALATLGLTAQEPASIGVQARISKAESGLKDVTGSSLPGLGASLVAEIDSSEGYRARLDIGYDHWQKGDLSKSPGTEGSANAFHVSVEGLMMLNPDGSPALGPYVLAGIGAYSWSVKEHEESTGTTTKRRGTHAAGIVGIGYRLGKNLDAELKVLAGRMVEKRTATAIQLGLTYRFTPSL